jgi:hypothetical protein
MQCPQLRVGGCYFILGFCDERLRLPQIEVVVYLGRNIEIEGDRRDEAVDYFQDVSSFARGGPAVPPWESSGARITRVYGAASAMVCDTQMLIDELREFAGRVS